MNGAPIRGVIFKAKKANSQTSAPIRGVPLYMFICIELIEEIGIPPGLIFGMLGYFWPGSDKFESWKIYHSFDRVMTYLSHFWKLKIT